jgi:hypothetical protein
MFSIASSKTGDRAGLAHSRRSYLASVVIDLIHHSRPRDGGGRLGNYLVLSDPESGKRILLASGQPAGRGAIERAYVLKINSSRIMVVTSAAFSDRKEVSPHVRAITTPCRIAA